MPMDSGGKHCSDSEGLRSGGKRISFRGAFLGSRGSRAGRERQVGTTIECTHQVSLLFYTVRTMQNLSGNSHDR